MFSLVGNTRHGLARRNLNRKNAFKKRDGEASLAQLPVLSLWLRIQLIVV